MSANTPENKVKARVTSALKALDLNQLPVQSFGMGEAGHPDRITCLRGFLLGVECKATRTSLPTALQTHRLEAIVKSGGLACVVDADNIEAFVDMLMDLYGTPAASLPARWAALRDERNKPRKNKPLFWR